MHPIRASISRKSRLGLAAAVWLLTGTAGAAQPEAPPPSPVTAAERAAVVGTIDKLLRERYVFPEVAVRCGEHLRAELAAGRFDQAGDSTMFATALTTALHSGCHDKHLRVDARPPRRVATERVNPLRANAELLAREQGENFGFAKVERLEGNVGYLDLRYFSAAPQARATAIAAMGLLASSDALIVDLRQNSGGSPEMIRFLSSYLFAEPTHLNSLYWRDGDRTVEFWTFAEVPGERLADVPVFVLTSRETFSGGEEFSYNLRTRERAILIGETTGGGANPGGPVPIDERFAIFIPRGRAINPITGTNWEGVGVAPHVAVAADQALGVGLEKAREAAQTRRAQQEQAAEARWAELEASQKRAEELAAKGDEAAATATFKEALARATNEGPFGEADLNTLGYHYLADQKHALAIAAFELNVARHPESSNVHDSLGEAYLAAGRRTEAAASYRRSLALDPANENAARVLERIAAGSD